MGGYVTSGAFGGGKSPISARRAGSDRDLLDSSVGDSAFAYSYRNAGGRELVAVLRDPTLPVSIRALPLVGHAVIQVVVGSAHLRH